MVFALAVNHEPLALENDERHENNGIKSNAQGPELSQQLEMGTRIKQPMTGPARVPLPPITVAAMGRMEKSRAKREIPANM